MKQAAALAKPQPRTPTPAISSLSSGRPAARHQCPAFGAGEQAQHRHPTGGEIERPGALQPKLTIAAPDDPLEREADAAADAVMRMPSPGAAPPRIGELSQPAASGAGTAISRKPAASRAQPALSPWNGLNHRTAGVPLAAGARDFFEPRFARDLGHVRIHDEPSAGALARAIDARAFTLGSDIYFAPGQYDPASESGRLLLAHELAHTVQQAGATMKSDGPLPVDAGPGFEAEAEGAARAVSSGRQAPALSHCGTAALLRRAASGAATGAGLYRQAAKSPDDPQLSGPPTFSGNAVNVAAMTNEQLNAEALRVDKWLRAHSTNSDPDLAEYWKLARKLRAERQLRVVAGHVWMASVEAETPTRLIGLLQQAGFHTVIEINLKKAFGPPESPGMLIMTEKQFGTLLASQSVSMVPPQGGTPGTNMTVPTYATATPGPSAATAPTVSAPPSGSGRQMLQGGPDSETGAGLQSGSQPPFSMLPDSSQAGPVQSKAGVATKVVGGAVDLKNIGFVKAFAGEYQPQNWVGKMAETSFQGKASFGYGSFMDPTNQRGWTDYAKKGADGKPIFHSAKEQNYPILDFEVVKGRLVPKVIGIKRVSVKASQGTPAQRLAYNLKGMAKMVDAGAGNTAFEKLVANQPGQSGTTRLINGVPNPAFDAVKRQILSESFLAVNEDDVAPFQKQLKNSVANWKHPQYRRLYEAELFQNPILVKTPQGTVSISHLDHISQNSFGLTPAQLDEVKLKIGVNVARRVVGSGIVTSEMIGLSTARKSLTLTSGDIELRATSQYIAQVKAGGGLKGGAIAAGKSGLRGGSSGTLIVLLTSVGEMVFDEADHPDWETELAEAGIQAFGPQALAGGTEQFVGGQASAYSLSGSGKWVSPKGVKFVSGGAGAGVVELLSMLALEARPHTVREYAARTGRSIFIGGTASVAGAAAGAGFITAVWGSATAGGTAGTVVPGWGNVVGFVIGLVVGVGTYLLLDTALPGSKEDWDKDYYFDPNSIRPDFAPSTALIDKTAVGSGAPLDKELIEADLEARRQYELEKRLMKGAPFAAGVDDEAIPAGYGLRDSERLRGRER